MSENSGSERQEEVGPRVSISVGNVDLALLGEQRAALVTVVDEMDLESLEGLLNFLDACVDCALDREQGGQGGQPPTIVVDVTEGGCHGIHVAGELQEAVRLELRNYDVSGLDPEDLVIDDDGHAMTVIAYETFGDGVGR